MTKDHVKRLAAPRTWNLKRKANVFVTKPRPGSHNKNTSVPLTLFFKGMAKLGTTTRELKYVLYNKTVLVNGRQTKEYRKAVGLFDVVTFKDIKKSYRITLNKQGKLVANEIDEKDNSIIKKVVGKTKVKSGKTQLNFLDGTNLLVEKDEYTVGNSVIIDNGKIKQNFKIQKGSPIFLIGGKHIGDSGVIEDIKGKKIIYKNNNELIETDKKYAFVTGESKPLVMLGSKE